jgi:hypothetical protein
MRASEKDEANQASLLQRIDELERKVHQLEKERGGPARP